MSGYAKTTTISERLHEAGGRLRDFYCPFASLQGGLEVRQNATVTEERRELTDAENDMTADEVSQAVRSARSRRTWPVKAVSAEESD